MSGILISGKTIAVDGLTITPPSWRGGPSWAYLDPRDYRVRSTSWIRQIINHSTNGGWPQIVVPGRGPGGRAERCAKIWRSDPTYSGAHLLVEDDVVYQLHDIGLIAAHHAEGSNPWSVGIEMCQFDGAHISEMTIATTAKLNIALCEILSIPEQMPDRYHGEPLMRMEFGSGPQRRNLGGANCVGVFGHRHNTGNRGRGDPGDELFRQLAAAGFETLDYDREQDLEVARIRQQTLNELGADLKVDGLVGPASIAAAKRLGFYRWCYVAELRRRIGIR